MSYRLTLATLCLLLSLGPNSVQAETFRIGAEDDWFPYTALRNGKIQGMSVDIVRAAFAASNTDIELVPYPYSRCMDTALRGEIMACFNTLPNKQIASEYLLPNYPLFNDDILLWANSKTARPVLSLAELSWQSVAVTIGYEYGAQFDQMAGIQRVPVRRDLNGFMMLQRGRVDYTAAYRGTVRALIAERPEFKDAFTPVATLIHAQLFLSFTRKDPRAPELISRFDKGMQIIHTNGTYQQILDHWHNHLAAD
ncbi:ABC transporter substrate-binding protein [Pseudomonas sp. M30-35]|uniref:substrate-binding periplasmic protein n=1 Tax=Pseudomonas sp. M30-35 TaxID=1981174 RepID=UPI0021151853|nr:transporter substrate-binding domain-containing protein [Pseudomonas sp. M30-35]